MDAFFSNLRPVLRAALNGPHAWIYVLVAAAALLILLGFFVSWASRGDAAASAELAQRAQALRERTPGQPATQQR